jgi:hypothetical protein
MKGTSAMTGDRQHIQLHVKLQSDYASEARALMLSLDLRAQASAVAAILDMHCNVCHASRNHYHYY